MIYFPYMHPELLPFAPLPNGKFFDPGLEDAAPSNLYFRPDTLPVSPRQGRALLEDCLRFGAQFKDPSEMAFFGAHTPEEYFKESTLTIKNELEARLKGTSDAPKESDKIPNAQFTLMLAWSLEKSFLESRAIEQNVRASWNKLGQGLGVDEAEEREAVLGKTMGDTAAPVVDSVLPWQRVMEALPPFLPDNAILLVGMDEPCVGVWEDLGISFEEVSSDFDLPQASRIVCANAWKLAGRKRCPESMPWAEQDVCVAVLSA